ncbi:MAG: AhpC/TSA family protein [Bacteroidales bacterium]|nr:AhpC/TSA family protein [Bacteroidales bacterium]
MNKNIVFIAVLLVALGCVREPGFKITGTVEGINAEWIYLDEQKVTSIISIDSAEISKDGSFSLSALTGYPKFYNLHLGDQVIIPLLIGPEDKPVIQCNAESFPTSYSIEGSEGSLQLKQLNERLVGTLHKLDSISRIIDNNPGISDEQFQLLNEEFIQTIEDQRSFSIKFVLEHPNSLASLYALYQKLDEETFVFYKNRDIQIMKITGQALDTVYPQSAHVQSLVTNAAVLEQRLRNAQIQQMVDGAESSIPEISLPDRFGDTISLSGLKGKVILLSFWASWDKPSSDFNYTLQEFYEKYQSKGLEIFQVSFDTDRNLWSRNIILDRITWINVSDLSYPESIVAGVYNITELPTIFLINREFEIVEKNPPIDELESRIEKLL